MFRIPAVWLAFLFAASVLWQGTNTCAQDVPEALTEIDDPSISATDRLVIKSVRESDPQTGEELVRAVRLMLDIDRFDDAKFYLQKLDGLNLKQDEMFELFETVGDNFFFSIHRISELEPIGKPIAKKFLSVARTVAVSPARLDSLIEQLNDKDISERSDAYRQLKQLGEPAVATLLNTFANDEKVKLFPGIRGAIRHMGEPVQGPLLGGARAGDLQVQVESIRALAHYKSPEAVDVMMRAYLSPKAPQHTRRIALDYLAGDSKKIDPAEIEKKLYERAMSYLRGEPQFGTALMGDVTVWVWNSDARRLISQKVPVQTASRIFASRRASDLYEIRPDLPRIRELYVLTQLEAAKRTVGPGKRINVDGLTSSMELQPEEVEGYLEKALEMDLVPAAVACCEVLEKIGSSDLVAGVRNSPGPLVKAILHGDRYLQFAAFKAIANLDPQTAYPGSSYMIALAVYLSQSENLGAGLIGHNRPDVSQSYAANFAAAGLVGSSVTDSRNFFQVASNNPDLEVLIVTDTLDLPHYAELIQQLRNDWRTKRIPVALLYRTENRSRRTGLQMGDDPLFVSIPFANDPVHVSSHVKQLKDLVTPWSVSNFDRRKHAAAALNWLSKIASDRAGYGFYNLGAHESKLARLLYVPGFASDAGSILARLGTPLAQRELVNFASQSAIPIDDRQKAAKAFIESVSIGGTLLTTREIQRQYDRYNASENEPEESQKILGSILDAIENRKRVGN